MAQPLLRLPLTGIRTSGHVRGQTEITQFGATPCGDKSQPGSGRKAVLHAYLAWVGRVA
jgi:hypothetical protein